MIQYKKTATDCALSPSFAFRKRIESPFDRFDGKFRVFEIHEIVEKRVSEIHEIALLELAGG